MPRPYNNVALNIRIPLRHMIDAYGRELGQLSGNGKDVRLVTAQHFLCHAYGLCAPVWCNLPIASAQPAKRARLH